MPMLVAPIAGILSDRIGSRPLLIAGMALMASALGWLAVISSPTVPYADLVPAFVMAGVACRSTSRRSPTWCCRA